VVESTRLESERTGNRTVGSNPTLSAKHWKTPHKLKLFDLMLHLCYDFLGFEEHSPHAQNLRPTKD
jgi:hypothetical protein